MAPETVVTLVKQTLEMVMILSAPLLIAALGTGLLISIFQAATQINESTITFVPKLVVIFIVIDYVSLIGTRFSSKVNPSPVTS